jgi:hypothetical protein
MRKSIYKLDLVCSNGQTLPITLATHNIERIPTLVEQQKVFYAARGYPIDRFIVTDIRYLLNLDDAAYEFEISFCDIVDEGDDTPHAPKQSVAELANDFEIDENFKLVPRRR